MFFFINDYFKIKLILIIAGFLNGYLILNIIFSLKNDFSFTKDNFEDLVKNYRNSSHINQEKCCPTKADGDSISYSVLINHVKYPQYVLLHQNKSINFECLNKSKEIKKILFWTTWFGENDFGVGLGVRKPFENLNCPVTNCELLNDVSRINESDYVVAHMWNIWDTLDKIPSYRPKFQRWLFMTYESPMRSSDYSKFNGIFNLTSTYMVNSDFPGMYQSLSDFIWEKNKTFDRDYDFSQNKFGFAAAVISNCRSDEKSNRFDYITEMKKYVKVDVFGECGKPCLDKFKDGRPGDCKQIIGAEYKFYLAFENSICKDYVTEKFFAILKYNIIPVVLGGGSYDKFIPSSGYINAHDFTSPKMLADYLKYLDMNATAYNLYFQWKEHVNFRESHSVSKQRFSPLCDMCIKLQMESYYGYKKNTIKDVGLYWNRKKNCKIHKISNLENIKVFNLVDP